MAFCSRCGGALVENAKFCGSCGNGGDVSAPPAYVGATPVEVLVQTRPATPSRRWIVGATGALVLVGMAWLYASPYVTLWRLESAVKSGDGATVGELVQWDALRASVKGEVRTVLQTVVQREATSSEASAGTALVGGFGSAISDALIDKLVTQENVESLVGGSTLDFSDLGVLGNAFASGAQTAMQSKIGEVGDWKTQLSQRVTYSMGYASVGQFVLQLFLKIDGQPQPRPVGRVRLTRRGLGWNVSGVQFSREVIALINTMNDTENSGSRVANQQATPQDSSSQAALDAMASLSEERELARQTEETPTSNQTNEERSLRSVVANWQRSGYAAASDIVLDKLDDKADKLYSFPFEGGQYVVTARCDADCSDLDLHLLDSAGASAVSDEEPDDAPTVSATVSAAGTINVKVVMAACSAQPCGYALVILRKQ